VMRDPMTSSQHSLCICQTSLDLHMEPPSMTAANWLMPEGASQQYRMMSHCRQKGDLQVVAMHLNLARSVVARMSHHWTAC
jgi:hypothetical protein